MERLTTLMSRTAIGTIDVTNLRSELQRLSRQLDRLSFMQIIDQLLSKSNVFESPEFKLPLYYRYCEQKTDFIMSPNGKYLYMDGTADQYRSQIVIGLDEYYKSHLSFRSSNIFVSHTVMRYVIFSSDDVSILFQDSRDKYHLLNFLSNTDTIIPFINNILFNYKKVDDLLIYSGDTPGIAKWKDKQMTLLGHISKYLANILINATIPSNGNCSKIILSLLDKDFADQFLKLLPEDDGEGIYPKMIFTSKCDWIYLIDEIDGETSINLIKVNSTNIQLIHVKLPVMIRNLEEDFGYDEYNYTLTHGDRLIIWSVQTVYIYDMKGTWNTIIQVSRKDGIAFIETHKTGLLIHWYPEELVGERTTESPIIQGNPVILPPFHSITKEQELISNFDLRSKKITFHLDNPTYEFEPKANLIKDGLIFYPIKDHEPIPKIYDSTGKVLNFTFTLDKNEAHTLVIDTNSFEFRLLKAKFTNPDIQYIQYISTENGLYLIRSYNNHFNDDERYPVIYYFDRRISFLKKLVDVKDIFRQSNIPLPSIYPNDLALGQILKLYNQHPYRELYVDPELFNSEKQYLFDKEFKQVILNLYYPGS